MLAYAGARGEMLRHRTFCVMTAALVSLALLRPALALGPAEPTPSTPTATAAATDPQKEAERLYKEGVKADASLQWEQARKLMSEAFAIADGAKLDLRYKIAANLGIVALKAGKAREAATALRFVLDKTPDLHPDDRAQTERVLAEAKSRIGVVTVRVDHAGTPVYVDDKLVGISPLSMPVFVDPGTHTFEAEKSARERVTKTFEVAAGSQPVVELELEKPKQIPHDTVGVRSKGLIYVGIGLSSAAALVGIGTAIGAGVKASERDDHTKVKGGTFEDYKRLEDERVALGSTAIYAFVGAGVVGAATAIYALTGKKAPPPDAQKTGIIVVPAGAGFVVKGVW